MIETERLKLLQIANLPGYTAEEVAGIRKFMQEENLGKILLILNPENGICH